MPIDFQAELKQVIDSHAAMYQAALAEGVKIGRREMRAKLYKPVMKLCDEVEDIAAIGPKDSPVHLAALLLVHKVKALLDEPLPEPAGGEDAQ